MSLFKKTIASFLLVSVIPIAIFGYFTIKKIFEIAQKEAFEANSFIARQIAGQTDTYFESVRKALESLASQPEIRDFNKERADELLKSYHTSYTLYYGYQTVFEANPFDSFTILDNKGIVQTVYPLNESYIGMDYSEQPFFQETSQTKKTYFSSSVSNSVFSGEPVIKIAAPIFKENKEISSVIEADIKLESIMELTNQVTVGETGYLFTISRDGTIITHPNEELVLKRQNIETINPGLLSEILKKGSLEEIILYPSKKPNILIAYSFSPTVDWIIVVTQSLSETLATPLIIRDQFIGTLFLIIIFIGFVAFFLSRGVTDSLKILTKRAVDVVVKEDLETEISIRTGDEVEVLALSFNQMMKRLKKKTADLEEARYIAEERTKEIEKRKEDLEKTLKAVVGRELRMVELKKEIKGLEEELKKKSSY